MKKNISLKQMSEKGPLSQRLRIIILIIDIISLPLIYWLVYATGGTKTVFTHSMYIPIVVAEGVKDNESLNYLREYGCDYGQGYFFAKPLKDQEIDEW